MVPGRPAAAAWLAAALCANAAAAGGGKNNNAKFYGPGTGGNLELVTELEPSSFEIMKGGREQWVVEFYAPWCPHCQHYKPEYAKVAGRVSRMSCSGGAAGPDHPVHIGAVNCVLEKELCQSEGIKSYPTVKRFDGSGATGEKQTARDPKALVAALTTSWGPCEEHTEQWVADLQAARESAAAAKESVPPELPGSALPASQLGEQAVSGRRHDVMEAVWFTFKTGVFAGRDSLSKVEADALLDWLTVLADLLPPGSGNDLIATSLIPLLLGSSAGTVSTTPLTFEVWDAAVSAAIVQLRARDPHSADGDGTTHEQLGEGSDWRFCADEGKHVRGYTCGLWTTFHTLSVRAAMETTGGASVGDGPGPGELTPGEVALAVYGFITHYFACNDCREHFLAAHDLAEVRGLPDKGNAVALWFWSAHNAVNERLRREDLAPTDGTTHDCWVFLPRAPALPGGWLPAGSANVNCVHICGCLC